MKDLYRHVKGQIQRPIAISQLVLLVVLISGCALPSLQQQNGMQEPAQPEATPVATTPPPTATSVEAPTATPERATTADTLVPTAALTPTVVLSETAELSDTRILVPTTTPAVGDGETGDGETGDGETGDGTVVVPPADAVAERLQVPDGFAVRLFAEGFSKPRLMTTGPDGALYVADQSAGTVVRLPDADGDGLADANEVIADGLPGAHSVEWFEGWLYVAAYGQVQRLQDSDGDGTFETQEVVTENIPGRGGHSTRTLHFGPDGKLYVAAGSTSNIDPESDARRATIMRFNPDGTIPADNPYATDADPQRQPVWAEGLRNSVDFLFLPDGRLWADHNGSDMLGDEIPPEEIVIEIEAGQHYGWPYCYTPLNGVVPAGTEEVRDERVDLADGPLTSCSEATPALFTDLAHAAPLGMTQYNATAFPATYQGNLFVAYHGSWNSSVPRDCRVQMIVVRDGQPVAGEPFLTGFRDSESQACNQAWGRPAGVAVGNDGALYVSDDQNGNIYRVVYLGE